MTPKRYGKIGQIFHAVMEVNSGERAAVLDRLS